MALPLRHALGILGWAAAASAPAAMPSRAGAESHVYKRVGNLAISADVYRPAGFPGQRPVVVWMHGGGMINGGRGLPAHDDFTRRLLEEGIIVVSIDYRLAPATRLPGIVSDVEDAFRWVRTRGPALFSADPNRVAAAGSSAGGYLALAAGFRVSPRPVAVVSFWGYGDLVGPWCAEPSGAARFRRIMADREEANRGVSAPPIANGMDRPSGVGDAFYQYCRRSGTWVEAISGWDPRKDPKKFYPYMPVRNVTRQFPPTLLIHGLKDTDVPIGQSKLMAAALEACGVEHRLVTDSKADHGSNWSPAARAAVDRAAVDFLQAHFRAEPLAAISNEADVDHALSPEFAQGHLGVDTKRLGAAWKSIVDDAGRPPAKVIIDTDIGTDIDDAIAVAFALRRPELEVCGITTSRGEVGKRAAIVSRLLQRLGRTDIPFAPGSPVRFDGSVRPDRPVDQYPFAGPATDRPSAAFPDAQALFRRVIAANPGRVWLVVLGPMTNAAILLRDHPNLARQLEGIACMGGSLAGLRAETNIVNDPAAADFVSRSGRLRFMATDEVAMRLLLPAADIARLEGDGSSLSAALLDLIALWRPSVPGKPGPVVFDACPLVWLVQPGLFASVEKGVAVDAQGFTRFSPALPPCGVSVDMDALAVHRLLIDTLAPGAFRPASIGH